MLTPSFLKLLDAYLATKDQQLEQRGLQNAPRDFGAAQRALAYFVVLAYLELVLVDC